MLQMSELADLTFAAKSSKRCVTELLRRIKICRPRDWENKGVSKCEKVEGWKHVHLVCVHNSTQSGLYAPESLC